MQLEKLLTLFTFLLAGVGFLSLSLIPPGHPLLIVLLLSLTFVAYLRFVNKQHLAETLNLPVLYGMIAFFLLDLLVSGLMTTLFHLVIGLQLYRMFTLKVPSDFLHIHLISFLQVLFVAGQAFGIEFSFIFLLFCFTATLSSILYHLYSKAHRYGVATNWRISPLFVGGVFALSSALLFFTLLLFFLFPRMGMFYFQVNSDRFQRKERQANMITGFTEEVVLGRVGIIKQSRDRVARLTIAGREKPLPFPVYLRGSVLEIFFRSSWKDLHKELKPMLGVASPRSFRMPFGVLGKGRHFRGELLVDVAEVDTLFLPAYTTQVSGRFPGVVFYPDGTVRWIGKRRSSSLYNIDFLAGPEGTVGLVDYSFSKELPASLSRMLTYVPEEMRDSLRRFARQWTQSLEPSYEQALALSEYLSQNYPYSTRLVSVQRPVLDFLSLKFPANCEYFASALALMLRSINIPARIVTGFAGGEWNEMGKFYLFTQSDAHTWVEAYFPGRGWILLDPTPPAPKQDQGLSLSRKLVLFFAALEMRWNKYIITYDRQKQLEQLARVQGFVKDRTLFFLFVAVVLALPLLSKYKKSLKPVEFRLFDDPYCRLFLRTEAQVDPSTLKTAMEKKEILPQDLKERYCELAKIYYAIRFGRRKWSGHDLQKLRAFRKMLQERKVR